MESQTVANIEVTSQRNQATDIDVSTMMGDCTCDASTGQCVYNFAKTQIQRSYININAFTYFIGNNSVICFHYTMKPVLKRPLKNRQNKCLKDR